MPEEAPRRKGRGAWVSVFAIACSARGRAGSLWSMRV